jgi:hypothetical protein
MKNIVITFGLISGGVLAAMTAIMIPLLMNGTIDFSNGELIGYSTMVLSFLAIFFGIRTYREKNGGGAITFGRAFKVGILITLISCAVYVLGWEIVYWNFVPDFADKYAALTLEKMRADGATPAEIAAETKKMAQFKEWYTKPLFNVLVTFGEVFPLGLLMTLISAAILRKKPAAGIVAAVPA